MTAVFLVSSFVLAVLLLNEREASNKEHEERNKAVRNYQAAEKWFVTAVSMASNEQEIVDTLAKLQRSENRKWQQDWHGDKEANMSVKDKRYVNNAMLEHLLKMHSQKESKG